jgi:hypothetical protein
MKRCFLLLLIILTAACEGDVDRDISTDLQVEGKEIFRVSLALEEALPFSFYSLEDYQTATPLEILGCPDINVDIQERKVTLTFSSKTDCMSQRVKRKGKIIIRYITTPQLSRQTHLSYQDYTFNDQPIEGSRIFQRSGLFISSGTWNETFEDLIVYSTTGSSTRISGTFIHQLLLTGGLLNEFSSTGSLSGRNITGRGISMNRITPRRYSNECLQMGRVLSSQGVENWQINRTGATAVSHNLTFSLVEGCNSTAKIILQDGRLMVFEL